MKKALLILVSAVLLLGQEAVKNAELIVEKEKEELRQKFLLKVDRKETETEPLTLVAKGEKEELIPLYDNGTHGDEVAGDGIFTGVSYVKPGSKRRFFLRGLAGGQTDAVFFEAVLFRW